MKQKWYAVINALGIFHFNRGYSNAQMLNCYRRFKSKLVTGGSEIPGCLRPAYYRPLDGLRGVAILIVILVHVGANHYLRPIGLYIDSQFGVRLFFVLSGFLITTLLIKEKIATGTVSLTHFYIRRLLKIVPVAYLFLLIIIVLNHHYRLEIPYVDFLASFFFVKNFPIKNEPLTAHFWTLAVEWQFYLTFPLLLAVSINKYFYTALFIVIIVPFVSVLGYFQIIDPNYLAVKIIMFAFWKGPTMILIGSVSSILLFKGVNINLPISKYLLTDLVLLVACIVIESKYFIAYIPYVSELISALIIAYTLPSVLKNRSLLTKLLESRILVNVGIISYSLYIWQQIFIGTRAWQPWLHQLGGLPIYLLMLIKLILIFGTGFISWHFIEKRFLKLKTQFIKPTPSFQS